MTKTTISNLQKSIGTVADGFWGAASQKALIDSGNKITYDWDNLKKKFGKFNQKQVDGFNTLLQAFNEHGGDAKNPTFIAYMLATAWHETAKTMQPIAEYGEGKGRKYGLNIDIDGSKYLNLPHKYFGRGYVQLTWLTNYLRMKSVTGVDLVNNPDLAMQPDIASKIMIVGMLEGMFTGKSLHDYIKYGLPFEFVNARRIINGTDKDKTIAKYASDFLSCLKIE